MKWIKFCKFISNKFTVLLNKYREFLSDKRLYNNNNKVNKFFILNLIVILLFANYVKIDRVSNNWIAMPQIKWSNLDCKTLNATNQMNFDLIELQSNAKRKMKLIEIDYHKNVQHVHKKKEKMYTKIIYNEWKIICVEYSPSCIRFQRILQSITVQINLLLLNQWVLYAYIIWHWNIVMKPLDCVAQITKSNLRYCSRHQSHCAHWFLEQNLIPNISWHKFRNTTVASKLLHLVQNMEFETISRSLSKWLQHNHLSHHSTLSHNMIIRQKHYYIIHYMLTFTYSRLNISWSKVCYCHHCTDYM